MIDRILKKLVGVIFMLMATLIMAAGCQLPVHAQDGVGPIQFDQFMKTLQPVDAKAEPDENAETIFSFEAGDYVYVTGETNDGWLIVYYQGQTGYINNNTSQGAGTVQNMEGGQEGSEDEQSTQNNQNGQIILQAEGIDIEALDKELAAQELENKMVAEGIERFFAEARRSKIWGAIIVLLVIGIFAAGIVSAIRAEKKDQ